MNDTLYISLIDMPVNKIENMSGLGDLGGVDLIKTKGIQLLDID